MKAVDSARMAQIDRLAEERFHLPQIVLMEDAGLRAWQLARARLWGGRLPVGSILFLAGKGNNGGDALVMARQCRLEGHREASIVLGAGDPPPESLAGRHLASCAALGIEVLRYPAQTPDVRERLGQAAWLVDGLLGTGLSGPARPPLAELIGLAAAAAGRRVAVDIPSGVSDAFRSGFPALPAELTLTIGLPKLCLYLPLARPFAGEILVVPSVFPAELTDAPDIPAEMLDDGALAPCARCRGRPTRAGAATWPSSPAAKEPPGRPGWPRRRRRAAALGSPPFFWTGPCTLRPSAASSPSWSGPGSPPAPRPTSLPGVSRLCWSGRAGASRRSGAAGSPICSSWTSPACWTRTASRCWPSSRARPTSARAGSALAGAGC